MARSCEGSLRSYLEASMRGSSIKVRQISFLTSAHSLTATSLAPKPITRRLVVSARPTLPTPQSSPEASPVTHQNPPRPKYPKELLTHRFMPIGSLAPVEDDTAMDVDEPAHTQSAKAQKVGEDGERPKKKKKSGIESPTKPKKSKVVS